MQWGSLTQERIYSNRHLLILPEEALALKWIKTQNACLKLNLTLRCFFAIRWGEGQCTTTFWSMKHDVFMQYYRSNNMRYPQATKHGSIVLIVSSTMLISGINGGWIAALFVTRSVKMTADGICGHGVASGTEEQRRQYHCFQEASTRQRCRLFLSVRVDYESLWGGIDLAPIKSSGKVVERSFLPLASETFFSFSDW